MEKTDPTESDEKRLGWDMKVIGAYRNALAPLSRIASTLIGLWVLASAIGWKRADSYYAALGAEWITSKLSIVELLSLSYWPVVALALGVLVTLTDLADRHDKSMKNVWRITYGLMLITFCFAWWFGWSDEYKKAASIYSTLLLMVALVLGILLGFLVLDVAEKNFRWTGKNVWMFTFLIIWYVSVVSSLGTNEGKRDKNVQQTQLNILETKAGEKLHMLLQKEGLVYAVLLMNGKYPKVKMIDVTEVMFISKADPKPGNKVQESKESKP
ncbi:MAG: hypothetical protein K8F26_02685 [Thiobacillus sp.]|jgi:hypothetical protein|nr:hypothetical protein [Thiobacillus sp.]